MERATSADQPVEILLPHGATLPVLVSIPHAGRVYPPDILAAARVGQEELARLEDRWCDLVGLAGQAIGATVVRANWARAVADCNRSETQMAPGEVAPALRPMLTAPGRKERAGLGVVPTRLPGAGALWKRPIDPAALEWRLDRFHRPYHAAIAARLAMLRARFGWALLIDLHSMPPIPPGQEAHGARIVIGDRMGTSSAAIFTVQLLRAVAALGEPLSHNRPYAGGHILARHARPANDIHALQIEIDRRLYIDGNGQPDRQGVARLGAWFAQAIAALAATGSREADLPAAAE